MDNLSINQINKQNGFYLVKKQVKPANNNAQNNTQIHPYPIYLNPPYEVKKSYIKTGTKTLPTREILHTYQLLNGQKVGIIKSDGYPIVQTRINVGSLDEKEEYRRISHLIEHSLYHGSKKYDDIDGLIDSIGGESNASTSKSATQYYIKLDET